MTYTIYSEIPSPGRGFAGKFRTATIRFVFVYTIYLYIDAARRRFGPTLFQKVYTIYLESALKKRRWPHEKKERGPAPFWILSASKSYPPEACAHRPPPNSVHVCTPNDPRGELRPPILLTQPAHFFKPVRAFCFFAILFHNQLGTRRSYIFLYS